MKTLHEECENSEFLSLVNTWMQAYDVICPTIKAKKIRLKELQTWDKSRVDNEIEHAAKKHALIKLLGVYA